MEIGEVAGEKQTVTRMGPGVLSNFPYAEASAFNGFRSPYYKESHHKFRAALREFYDNHIVKEAMASEDAGKPPTKETWQKSGKFGLLAARM